MAPTAAALCAAMSSRLPPRRSPPGAAVQRLTSCTAALSHNLRVQCACPCTMMACLSIRLAAARCRVPLCAAVHDRPAAHMSFTTSNRLSVLSILHSRQTRCYGSGVLWLRRYTRQQSDLLGAVHTGGRAPLGVPPLTAEMLQPSAASRPPLGSRSDALAGAARPHSLASGPSWRLPALWAATLEAKARPGER